MRFVQSDEIEWRDAMIRNLRHTLRDAKEKLTIYYQQTNATYSGGIPYDQLIKRINAALGDNG